MIEIILKMFEGWMSLGILMIIPVIYLLIYRATPKKVLFVLSAAIVTAGVVNVLYYLVAPVIFWAVNILPETCANEPNAMACRFFQSFGESLEVLPLIVPVFASILVSHLFLGKITT
jgi:hypothetical protein